MEDRFSPWPRQEYIIGIDVTKPISKTRSVISIQCAKCGRMLVVSTFEAGESCILRIKQICPICGAQKARKK